MDFYAGGLSLNKTVSSGSFGGGGFVLKRFSIENQVVGAGIPDWKILEERLIVAGRLLDMNCVP